MPKLSDDDKKLLLALAREAIVTYVREGVIPTSELSVPSLRDHYGCFVCIKKTGNCAAASAISRPASHCTNWSGRWLCPPQPVIRAFIR